MKILMNLMLVSANRETWIGRLNSSWADLGGRVKLQPHPVRSAHSYSCLNNYPKHHIKEVNLLDYY